MRCAVILVLLFYYFYLYRCTSTKHRWHPCFEEWHWTRSGETSAVFFLVPCGPLSQLGKSKKSEAYFNHSIQVCLLAYIIYHQPLLPTAIPVISRHPFAIHIRTYLRDVPIGAWGHGQLLHGVSCHRRVRRPNWKASVLIESLSCPT